MSEVGQFRRANSRLLVSYVSVNTSKGNIGVPQCAPSMGTSRTGTVSTSVPMRHSQSSTERPGSGLINAHGTAESPRMVVRFQCHADSDSESEFAVIS